jgi:uncharacterized protein HemY
MDQERQELIANAKAAETLDQIKEAKAALTEWYTAHPDDYEMNRLLGDLTMREAWLRIRHHWH